MAAHKLKEKKKKIKNENTDPYKKNVWIKKKIACDSYGRL